MNKIYRTLLSGIVGIGIVQLVRPIPLDIFQSFICGYLICIVLLFLSDKDDDKPQPECETKPQ